MSTKSRHTIESIGRGYVKKRPVVTLRFVPFTRKGKPKFRLKLRIRDESP